MDLTTLIAACALVVDPKVMHALVWHQSGGEPWSFSVAGQRQPRVLGSLGDAMAAARDTRPGSVVIRVGLAGLPATPRSVTASMFAPCSNIASAARQIAQFAQLCMTSTRANADPVYCAVAAYHGSWARPDHRFADSVRATVAGGDAPDFEMPVGIVPRIDDTVASPPSVPDDDQRAWDSPLFPVVTGSSDRSAPSPAEDRPRPGGPGANPAPCLRTAQPSAEDLFAPRSTRPPPSRSE